MAAAAAQCALDKIKRARGGGAFSLPLSRAGGIRHAGRDLQRCGQGKYRGAAAAAAAGRAGRGRARVFCLLGGARGAARGFVLGARAEGSRGARGESGRFLFAAGGSGGFCSEVGAGG